MSTSELLERLEHIRNCFSDHTPLLYIVNLFEDLCNDLYNNGIIGESND